MNAKYCPKCKSIDVKIDITPSASFGLPQKWSCNKCGFESNSIFPEKEMIENEKYK